MNYLTLLIKPASSLCNMRCTYCFYEDVANNRTQKSMGIMTRETARRLLTEVFRVLPTGGGLSILFQGGEPTLAGLDFFRDFVAMAKECGNPGVEIQYSIQTNGYCIDREWAAFFRENRFLVGLSIDGTQTIHDTFRLDSTGKGTWDRTVNALKLLDGAQVETNLLCVVTAQIAKKARQVYRSLRQLGDHPLQFIPCLDPLEEGRGTLGYSLTPDAYGTFLCQLFDCWYRDWKAGYYVSIRNFDDYLRHLLRLPPGSCAAAGSCGHYLVVEGDGSLYPCDFYVLDAWKLGNIWENTVEEAMNSSTSQAFLEAGKKRPEECRSCRYLPLCRGGCKRDWERTGGNYYCQSYRTFFAYSVPRLEEMAAVFARMR